MKIKNEFYLFANWREGGAGIENEFHEIVKETLKFGECFKVKINGEWFDAHMATDKNDNWYVSGVPSPYDYKPIGLEVKFDDIRVMSKLMHRKYFLCYNDNNGRMAIKNNFNEYLNDGLSCGYCFKVKIDNAWEDTRIELGLGDKWYLVNIPDQYQDNLAGLEVKIN